MEVYHLKNYKYLLKNIGLLTISQFGTKFLSFFLVPLYTSFLTTTEYGIYDVINTTISLLIPICTLNIMQSVMRFSLEKNSDKTAIFSIGIKIYAIGFFIVSLFTMINKQFNFIPIISEYAVYFVLIFICFSLQELLVNFARGLNNVLVISISGILNTCLTVFFNILFLVVLNLSLVGYFLACILGTIGTIIYLAVQLKVWQYLRFSFKNLTLKQEMLAYSIPLILNSIAWWINNASDRYIIIMLCGIASNGIYSVAYKIPNILNIFQTIFNQAWVLSTVDNYDKDDTNGFFSNTYNVYNFGMVALCSLLIISTKVLAHFLYAKDFYNAWIYVPFLSIAIIFGAMSGHIGGIFSAVKNSKIFSYTTTVGAILNLVLNYILVTRFGAIGAAIATTISYYVVWLTRLFFVKKYITLKINLLRDHLAYLMLLAQTFLILFFESTIWIYGLEVMIFIIIMIMYKDILLRGLEIIKVKLK